MFNKALENNANCTSRSCKDYSVVPVSCLTCSGLKGAAAALSRLSCSLTGNDSINHTSQPESNQVRRTAAGGGTGGSEG